MLRRTKWVVLLALALTLVSTFRVGSPQALAFTNHHAAQHAQAHGAKPLIYTCGFNGGNYGAVVDYNNYNNQVYFCGTGYTGTYIQHVSDVYNNSGFNLWILWYQGSFKEYCTVPYTDDASWGGGNPVLITQIDIDASKGPLCP